MYKRLILLTALALLSACAERTGPPPTPSLTVGFADESTAARLGSPVIEIKAANPQPLVTAELVSAGGNVIAAAPGQLEPQMPAGYPFGTSIGIFGGSWGSSSGGGIGVGVPLGGYGSATVPQGELVRSRALILVPDMASYRRNWENSKVRVKFGNAAGDTSVAEIPAPAPGGR
ncbi:MAG TPA: hypothetical protein VHM01_19050 [Alphaproteobacteria bacterium]|nr:hypothetical protein [Alphaproteobacteria bacterium]